VGVGGRGGRSSVLFNSSEWEDVEVGEGEGRRGGGEEEEEGVGEARGDSFSFIGSIG